MTEKFPIFSSRHFEDGELPRFGRVHVVDVVELAAGIESVGPGDGGRFRSKARHQKTSDRHNCDRETNCCKVFTTDFLITSPFEFLTLPNRVRTFKRFCGGNMAKTRTAKIQME
ncbi:MAG TPA: hypothetical protein VF480_09790 [Verrucomicrobiae bacterium]